jgi:hypothetical protein
MGRISREKSMFDEEDGSAKSRGAPISKTTFRRMPTFSNIEKKPCFMANNGTHTG